MVEMWVVGWWALFDMEEEGEGERGSAKESSFSRMGTKSNFSRTIFVESSMGFQIG